MRLGQKKKKTICKVYNFSEELIVLMTFLKDAGVKSAYILCDGENLLNNRWWTFEEVLSTRTPYIILGKDDSTTPFINALCSYSTRSRWEDGNKPLIRICLDNDGTINYHIFLTKYGSKEHFLTVLKLATKKFCMRKKTQEKLKNSQYLNVYKDAKIYTKSGFNPRADLSKLYDINFFNHIKRELDEISII